MKTNSTTNKAKVTDKATLTTAKNKINLKKPVPTKTPIHQDISTGANQTKKNSVSTSLKKLNYTGPKPNKSKFLSKMTEKTPTSSLLRGGGVQIRLLVHIYCINTLKMMENRYT